MGGSLLFSRRHPAQLIALLSLIIVGTMYFVQSGFAAGGGDDLHLDITIRDGMDTQAVYVGLGILLFVYALIITEVVHRTLAAALGGLLAVIALNFYSNQDTLSLKAVTTMIDWETIGLLLGMMVMLSLIHI